MRYWELNEAFDKVMPFTWAHFGDDTIQLYRADFQIDDGHFIVEFREKYYQRGYWELSFVRNESLDLTGTGNAGSVFATVIQITREFIRDMDPRYLSFMAKNEEASRNKLYPKLMQRLQREFPQYVSSEPKTLRTWTGYELSRPRKEYTPPVPEKTEDETSVDFSAEEWEELLSLVNDLETRPS